jgi:hypothetical protein
MTHIEGVYCPPSIHLEDNLPLATSVREIGHSIAIRPEEPGLADNITRAMPRANVQTDKSSQTRFRIRVTHLHGGANHFPTL